MCLGAEGVGPLPLTTGTRLSLLAVQSGEAGLALLTGGPVPARRPAGPNVALEAGQSVRAGQTGSPLRTVQTLTKAYMTSRCNNVNKL